MAEITRPLRIPAKSVTGYTINPECEKVAYCKKAKIPKQGKFQPRPR